MIKRNVMKPKILIMQAGGTPTQEKGNDGVYRPSHKLIQEPLRKIAFLDELADITIEELFNIDSTNMETMNRVRIAVNIYQKFQDYDGFVILHGTDTMIDSAAAINYMLQNLGKPIVFTGSQKSLFEPASDAPNNIYNAVKTATLDIGEVVIAFRNRIFRGVRAIKESEYELQAFSSPRINPLGEIEKNILLKNHIIPRYEGEPVLFTSFDTNIEVYRQSSGTTTNTLEYLAENKEIHGIVLEGYGAGNIQNRLVPSIEKAAKAGKPILVVASCRNCRQEASDKGFYEVGLSPLKAGAISAGNMTLEAATQKLMYAMGKANSEEYIGEERIALVKGIIHKDINCDITETGERFIQKEDGGYTIFYDGPHPMEREIGDHVHIIFSGSPEDIRISKQKLEKNIKGNLDESASNVYDHGRNYEIPLERWNQLRFNSEKNKGQQKPEE